MDWSSASENTKEHEENGGSVYLKCCDDKRRRRGDEWKCLFQWVCLLPLHMESWNAENACENSHRNQIQPHKSKWKLQFVLSFPVLIQHPGRRPICEISGPFSQSFWAWIRFWEGRGGPSTQKGDSVPRCSRFRPTVRTKMHLWLWWQSLEELLPDVGPRNPWETAYTGSIETTLTVHGDGNTSSVKERDPSLSWKDTLCWMKQLSLAEAAHDYNGMTL